MRGGLLVFADTPEGAAVCCRRFGGLTTVERGIRTMARAGVDRLLVVVPEGVEPKLSKRTRRLHVELEVLTWGQRPQTDFADVPSVLVLLGDHVHHHSSLTAFVAACEDVAPANSLAADSLAADSLAADSLTVITQVSPAPEQDLAFLGVQVNETDLVFPPAGASADSVSTGVFLCAGSLAPQQLVAARLAPVEFLADRCAGGAATVRQGDATLWRRVVDRRSARQAKAMLFGQVTKKTSGPVSRHINARLSIPISKILIETGISPHMVTVLFVLTTGLTAAWFMAHPEPYWHLALAGVFWQMAAVLDRCDGEIARVKLCESKFGAWFDTVTDNIAYLATYVGFLFGVQVLYPDSPWALYFGISAIGALLVALGIMYNYALKTGSGSLQNYLVGFRNHVPAGEKNSVYRLLERYAFIAKRDFFAFVHFICCLLGSFELLYAYTVGGLHLIVLGVLISQRKMLAGHARSTAAPVVLPEQKAQQG